MKIINFIKDRILGEEERVSFSYRKEGTHYHLYLNNQATGYYFEYLYPNWHGKESGSYLIRRHNGYKNRLKNRILKMTKKVKTYRD